MTLAELYRELEGHDWFYEMSDDHRVYTSGRDNERHLQREAATIEGGRDLMSAYSKHVFSGPAFGSPKAPKPPRPDEVTGVTVGMALEQAKKGQS